MLFNFDLEPGILEHSGNRNPELSAIYSILLTLQNDDGILELARPLRFDRLLLSINLLSQTNIVLSLSGSDELYPSKYPTCPTTRRLITNSEI